MSRSRSRIPFGSVADYERATEEIYRREYGDLASLRSGQKELLTFRVGEALHALPLASIVEVARPPAISAVPFTPKWVEGVMWLRGAVVPVFRVSRLLGAADAPEAATRRVLIASRPGDRSHSVGLLVDEVLEVIGVPQEEMKPPPPGAASDWVVAEAEKGGRRYAILDDRRLASAVPPLGRPG